jgi:regulator of replication initiation timing
MTKKIDGKVALARLLKEISELIKENVKLKLDNAELKQKFSLYGVVKPFYCQSKNVAEINYNDLDFEKCKKQCDWCKAI